jgi:hypothetical protein
MSRTHKGRKFREFSMLNKRYVNNNYLKYYKLAKRDVCARHEVTENELECMLFMYDYEFFTRKHIAEALHQNMLKFYERVMQPLMKKGMIERVYYRNDLEKATMEQLAFIKYDKSRYRARYQITQKARLMVQRFYRKLHGEEVIKIAPRKSSGDERQG